jgi:hypothetical protein
MNKTRDVLTTVYISLFLIAVIILFTFIVFVPFTKNLYILEYAGICLCFVTGIIVFLRKRTHFNLFILLALFFTLIADTFLVLLSPHLNYTFQSLAMTSFSLCQICYLVAIQLVKKSKRELCINLAIRAALLIALEVVALVVLQSSFNYLVFVSLFYFSQLVVNIVFSFIHARSHLFLALGLLLFLGCDFFIGLGYLVDILQLPADHFINSLISVNFNFAWLFYLPSQVLLSLSGLFSIVRRHKLTV